MGYILPIRHYEQEQYNIRDIASKQKIYKKEEVTKIAKINNTMDHLQLQKEADDLTKQQMHENQLLKERMIAQITGKGTRFHASI
ncbi:hypothetical protein [Bacillus sp. B1-b2]|uniref:hypothetical protein n=1 Tax=Bacillus sp. B1-b2 TaxID=2653201 RepID=UPI0012625241|nr:hypothetical protein [Bacillus sp. B1-b2]KAB7667583.1 hypothetical protein F9279_15085 [Bacillus sp. B1-b2]